MTDSSRPLGHMGPWSHLCFCGRCTAHFLPVPGTSVTHRGKVQIQNGRLETRPFYSDTASDFIMVKFIKVITSLKSHQEKQIWTYSQAYNVSCTSQHKKELPVPRRESSAL